MAKSRPLYTIEDQYALLDQNLDDQPKINVIKYRLLMACSSGGTLDQAKNRFLNLIQDTEFSNLFESLIEVPDIRITEGVNRIQDIHSRFSPTYGFLRSSIREALTLGIPRYTLDVLENYFKSNEDPVYKLSGMASLVMLTYIKVDQINNVKG